MSSHRLEVGQWFVYFAYLKIYLQISWSDCLFVNALSREYWQEASWRLAGRWSPLFTRHRICTVKLTDSNLYQLTIKLFFSCSVIYVFWVNVKLESPVQSLYILMYCLFIFCVITNACFYICKTHLWKCTYIHFVSNNIYIFFKSALKSKKIFQIFCISYSKIFCRKITSENTFSCSGVLYC